VKRIQHKSFILRSSAMFFWPRQFGPHALPIDGFESGGLRTGANAVSIDKRREIRLLPVARPNSHNLCQPG
jgi:hypothetical protein